MISKKTTNILSEIFDPTILSETSKKNIHFKAPNFKELTQIATLISNNSNEEAFQKFFSKYPNFLFRSSHAAGDPIVGILSKPPIGNFYKADFAILTHGQGGCGISLIELENPSDNLFTKKLTPAKKLQNSIGQITEWNELLLTEKKSFVNTTLELLYESPLFPDKSHNGSFRTSSPSQIKKTWDAFGGFDDCHIGNIIVIGRWSNLNVKERKRLLFHNHKKNQNFFQIRTYDQIIRMGLDGPSIVW